MIKKWIVRLSLVALAIIGSAWLYLNMNTPTPEVSHEGVFGKYPPVTLTNLGDKQELVSFRSEVKVDFSKANRNSDWVFYQDITFSYPNAITVRVGVTPDQKLYAKILENGEILQIHSQQFFSDFDWTKTAHFSIDYYSHNYTKTGNTPFIHLRLYSGFGFFGDDAALRIPLAETFPTMDVDQLYLCPVFDFYQSYQVWKNWNGVD